MLKKACSIVEQACMQMFIMFRSYGMYGMAVFRKAGISFSRAE